MSLLPEKKTTAIGEEDAAKLDLGVDFQKAHCLFHSEVALILQQRQDEYELFKSSNPLLLQTRALSK